MCRTVARQECGRVHSAQPARSRVAHDDCLHATDSVHADDFCVRHHRQLTLRGLAEASQARHHSRTARTQDRPCRTTAGDCHRPDDLQFCSLLTVSGPQPVDRDGCDRGVRRPASRSSLQPRAHTLRISRGAPDTARLMVCSARSTTSVMRSAQLLRACSWQGWAVRRCFK
jgi:hypothetical protein